MKNIFLVCAQLLFFSSLVSMEYVSNEEKKIDEYLQQIQISPISILPDDIKGEILFNVTLSNPVFQIPQLALVCNEWFTVIKNNGKFKKLIDAVKSYNLHVKQEIIQEGSYGDMLKLDGEHTPEGHLKRIMNDPFFCANFKFKGDGYAELLMYYNFDSALRHFILHDGKLPELSLLTCKRMCTNNITIELLDAMAQKKYDFASTDLLNCAIQANCDQEIIEFLIAQGCDINKKVGGQPPLFDLLISAYSSNKAYVFNNMLKLLVKHGVDQTITAELGDFIVDKNILLSWIPNNSKIAAILNGNNK